MCASASRGLSTSVLAPNRESEEAPGLNQLLLKLLLEMLSYLLPSMLLQQCRQICWYWHSGGHPGRVAEHPCPITALAHQAHHQHLPVFPLHPTQDDDNPRPCIPGLLLSAVKGCKFILNPTGKKGFCSHMMPRAVAMTMRKKRKTWGSGQELLGRQATALPTGEYKEEM